MGVARQPLVGLPIPAPPYLISSRQRACLVCSSTGFRSPLQLRIQGPDTGYRMQTSYPLCVAGLWLNSPFIRSLKTRLGARQISSHMHTKVKGGPVRCEAAGSAFSSTSNPSWNERVLSSSDPTFGQRFRAFCFYITTYAVALPLFVVMLFVQPFVLLFDKHKRKAQHLINKIWASITILPFYKAEFEGFENLPGPDEAAVYVSNHQSFLDIYTLFLLNRPFKFISKTSNFLIPIIGWSMYLTGHVPLRRMDTRSQVECLKHCLDLVRLGVPIFFFPEGTRSRDGKMRQFKKGAFSIAAKTNVPVIPISLIGTGKLMPNGKEGTLSPGSVKVIIHPPLQGKDADILCAQARFVISQSLLKHGLPVE